MSKTTVDKSAVAEHFKMAAYHLAECWDELRALEMITGKTIESDNEALQFLAGEVACPASIPTVDEELVDFFLETLQ